MSTGVKHLVTCRCTLPQFKRNPNPPLHQFTVFSVIDDNDKVVAKYAQCNNCNVIHRVTEINRSTILLNKEAMTSIISISDIKQTLPQRLVELLETNQVDLPTWEMTKYIYLNKNWGEFVVLSFDNTEETRSGKYVRILGENMFDVQEFERKEIAK